jgi:tRNA G46 methylase TrmB
MVSPGKTLNPWTRRFARAVRRHGIFGIFKVAAGHTGGLANRWRPSVRAAKLESERRAHDFDEQFGVDTGGCIHPTDLTIDSPNQLHAVSYGGTDPRDFRIAIASLPIDYRRFVFVDFGSGKGRVLLLATEFPFKRVVGIEFSEELHRIAQENISRFSSNVGKCAHVESIWMDAVKYSLPEDPVVCYFCNPFDRTIMSQVLENIRRSLARNPREIVVVYYNAKDGYLFDQADCFDRVETSGWARIWRTSATKLS